ncbi:MAG: branched-chain amino acid ABC transporter permease [Comamonadaceae bacterium]|jgi:branched-chain amino acid transport system permease protein|nr:branched-chain amino acid ABC transporter permease [Comamonadaceae bacterium]
MNVQTKGQLSLLGASRLKAWEWVLWPLLLLAPLIFPSQALIINEIAIVALFAISLDMILGYTGIVSLGHAAFFGLGGYAAGLLAKHVSADPLTGLLAAAAVSAAAGAVMSLTILRGNDLTRLMVTLGFALILYELANKLDGLTGGADGLQGVTMGPLLGRFEFDLFGRTAALYSLSVLLLAFVVLRRVVHSPYGATLMAIRDNRLRAQSIGIPVASRLASVYTLAAGVAGLAGALLTQTTGFASLDLFDIHRSADVMLMLVIGGTGWLYGGIFGAAVFKVMQDVLSNITPQYWTFWLGLFLVVLVLVGRERLVNPRLWLRGHNTGGQP